jgi:hypothetical protein
LGEEGEEVPGAPAGVFANFSGGVSSCRTKALVSSSYLIIRKRG